MSNGLGCNIGIHTFTSSTQKPTPSHNSAPKFVLCTILHCILRRACLLSRPFSLGTVAKWHWMRFGTPTKFQCSQVVWKYYDRIAASQRNHLQLTNIDNTSKFIVFHWGWFLMVFRRFQLQILVTDLFSNDWGGTQWLVDGLERKGQSTGEPISPSQLRMSWLPMSPNLCET